MPGITNPAEEYFKDGVWGYVTTAWKKLVATAAGALHIYIAGQAADVEVKQVKPWLLTPGIFGWDGSGWHRLPMLWGYSDNYAQNTVVADAAAGANTITFSTCPAGQVWVVTSVIAFDWNNAISGITIELYDGSVACALRRKIAVAKDEEVRFTGHIYLKESSRVRVVFDGVTLDDGLRASIGGYKMKVAE